jgi:hypothetical protein
MSATGRFQASHTYTNRLSTVRRAMRKVKGSSTRLRLRRRRLAGAEYSVVKQALDQFVGQPVTLRLTADVLSATLHALYEVEQRHGHLWD